MRAETQDGRFPRWLRIAFVYLREGSDKPAWVRYTSAVCWVLIAFAIRKALSPAIGDRVPFSFFVTSALIAAWCGGAGPGFFALGVGLVLGDWFFLPPVRHIGNYGSIEWALLIATVIPAVIGILLFETLHQHRRRLRADAIALQDQIQRCSTLEKEIEAARGLVIEYATDLELAVTQRTSELNEAVRCMETFCYSIAHDLRAPVRAMIGFTHAMLESCGTKSDAHAHATRVLAAAQRMDRLVTDLLEYGKLSHTSITLCEVSLTSVVAEGMSLVRSEIDQSDASIHIIEPMPKVWADPTLLSHAMAQLLSNALRFPRPGTPLEITISAEELPGSVRLYVADNGRGIPKEYQPRIFGVFETLEPRGDNHTGIGLAMVAKIVERLHGQVAVKSEPDKGASFLIDLPKTRHPMKEITRPDNAMQLSHSCARETAANSG